MSVRPIAIGLNFCRAWKPALIALSIALLTSGCTDQDRIERQVAQCKMSPEGARVGVHTCMRAQGYVEIMTKGCIAVSIAKIDFPECYEDDGFRHTINEALRKRGVKKEP